ncbi:histidine--tRNA ligase [Methanimicrococcus blatticola]|uniref:Histidine--tRNA ligase n=1 Tax=Methanimicrococcus blatticola TaxID=91560 RepID=A0A484F232_9EURY|nr:histidine--tRNA ligase [Methanimicrococcus blatticola]MBZ3936347.1 histidine--tRNA ligase [Methanimicrococcus blatticola]MCC2509509.1 histidine--tRNA ligase [Methanimicrococcus blatticola]TDQ67562.1 histidyl-tRNA synthetase [Methanimicrococcus blatticola]
MTVSKPRGTRDFLPEEMAKRRAVEFKLREVIQKWGYGEIVTPTFEELELFTLKSGQGIIGELYNFTDKGDREMTLRPELTAPVMRAYVNEMQSFSRPIKLFYFENCFRYERPQKGRYREFWQFGAELIGSNKPEADAEVIALAMTMISAAGIKGDLNIGNLSVLRYLLAQITTESVVSDQIMRYIDKKEYENLDTYLGELSVSADLIDKIHKIISLSGKDGFAAVKSARDVVGDLPELDSFEKTLTLLASYGVTDYTVNFGVARGLDYYTGIVFEVYAEGLGAQKQICGGGSYKLISLFGGGDVVSTGFGIGFDRIMEICDLPANKAETIVLITKPETQTNGIEIAGKLRPYVSVLTDIMGRNFKAQMEYANTVGADYVLIVGEKEIESGLLSLKDMKSGEQVSLSLEELISKFS